MVRLKSTHGIKDAILTKQLLHSETGVTNDILSQHQIKFLENLFKLSSLNNNLNIFKFQMYVFYNIK